MYSYLESTARECPPLSRVDSSSPLLSTGSGEGSGGGGGGRVGGGSSSKPSVEAAYAKEYEARISPFNAFQKRERQVSA
jgi:hypothetical protein